MEFTTFNERKNYTSLIRCRKSLWKNKFNINLLYKLSKLRAERKLPQPDQGNLQKTSSNYTEEWKVWMYPSMIGNKNQFSPESYVRPTRSNKWFQLARWQAARSKYKNTLQSICYNSQLKVEISNIYNSTKNMKYLSMN